MKNMSYRFISIASALLLMFVFASESPAQNAARIISLSPAITESLFLLGLKDNVVGVTRYCVNPVEARTKERIGTVIEPDLEKIIKLKPDLVLAMGLTDHKSILKMKNLGFTVITYAIPDTFSGICDVFLDIGRATGRIHEARRIVMAARAQVAEIQTITSRLDKPRVLIQLGIRPFFVATGESFVNDYLTFGGAINIFGDAPSGTVGREEALIRNPDVILVVTMGLSADNEKTVWNKYRSISAVRKSRVYSLNSDDVCSPTPGSFVQALKKIAYLLHPHELQRWK